MVQHIHCMLVESVVGLKQVHQDAGREGGTAVKGENFKFTGREAESGQTTEQFRSSIAGLNPQAGSRVTPVVSSHSTGNDTIETLIVASNAAGNAGQIAARG